MAVAAGGSCGAGAATDRTGTYSFTTVTPGVTRSGASQPPSTWDPPFFAITVFARGLLDRLFTRAYLPGHPHDRLLASLPGDRQATWVAEADDHGFVFDIRLQADDQGEGETVFLSHSGTPD